MFNYLRHPDKSIPDWGTKYKNINEYFYSCGFNLMKRDFLVTRIAMPFMFAKDLNYEEELAIMKVSYINLLIYYSSINHIYI